MRAEKSNNKQNGKDGIVLLTTYATLSNAFNVINLNGENFKMPLHLLSSPKNFYILTFVIVKILKICEHIFRERDMIYRISQNNIMDKINGTDDLYIVDKKYYNIHSRLLIVKHNIEYVDILKANLAYEFRDFHLLLL